MPEPNAGTSPSGGAAGSGGGLFGEWMKTVLNNGATPPSTPKKITDKLKSNLATTFGELRRWITVKVESDEIKELCGGVGDLVSWGGWGRNPYMQNLCKAVVEIRYFISNVETTGSRFMGQADERARIAPLTPDEAYRRCIVGAVALSAMYGDHCQLTEIIEKITKDVDSKLGKHLSSKDRANLDECKNISAAELMIGRALLHNTIKTWTEEERMKGGGGTWKVKMPWRYWADVCKQKREDANLQQQRKDNAEVMTNFLKLDNRKTAGSSGGTTLAEVLTNENLQLDSATIEKALQVAVGGNGQVDLTEIDKVVRELNKVSGEKIAQECMKNSSKKFCERLDCAKDYWNLTKEKSSSNTGDFWDSNVKEKLNSLLSTTTINADGTTANLCENGDLDSANKAACKHMAKFLHEMYKNGSSDPNKYSEQIIKCLLLKAYAEELKKKAKEGGYCSIDDGIKKALEYAETIKAANCNGSSKPCVECTWKNDDDYSKLDKCTIGSTTTESVKNKVETVLSSSGKTNQAGLQKTLIAFNTNNELCEWVNCAAKRWKENNQNTGKEQFWTKSVQQLWNELAGAMKGSNWNGRGNGCDQLKGTTQSEQTACNYLHAGLEALYNGTSSSPAGGDDILSTKHPSFRQAMGCFLLHSYAKYMKDKATCNIDKGINTAFESWKNLKDKPGTSCNGATGKGQCVPCEWDKNNKWESCLEEITINSNIAGSQDNAKKKVEEIVNEKNDTNIKEMLTEINEMTSLCDHMKCIETHLNSSSSQQQKNPSAEEFWKEGGGAVAELWKELVDAMTNSTDNENQCNTMDDYRTPTKPEKTACNFLHAGLHKLYNPTGTTKNGLLSNPSFRQTMGCFLLHAYANEMKKKSICEIDAGVKKAFDSWKNPGSKPGTSCNGPNGKGQCVPCEWKKEEYKNCSINTNGTSTENVEGKLKGIIQEDKDVAVKKAAEAVNTMNLCERAKCAVNWYNRTKGNGVTTTDWTKMWTEVKNEVTSFDSTLPDNAGSDNDTDTLCREVKCTNDGNGEHCVSRETCKLIVRALKEVHKIGEGDTVSGPQEVNNRIFKSTIRCMALNAFVHKLKDQADKGGYGCAVEKGIKGAFDEDKLKIKREEWCGKNGNEKGSCEECKEQMCVSSKIEGQEVWKKVLDMLNNDSNTKIQPTLDKINEKATLCDRMNCIANWYHEKGGQGKGEATFWAENDGDVAKLWDELLQAMKDSKGTRETECDNTVDGTRSDKTACNYLHAGFKQLYQPDTSSGTTSNGILSRDNPSFRQTMGCFLLHAYAKHMKQNAICNIERGITQAFKLGETLSKSGTNCNINGKGPCVPCQWQEDILNTCTIKTNGSAPGAGQDSKVEEKLKTTVNMNDDSNIQTMLTKINTMSTLCDGLQCIASHLNSTNGKPSNSTTKDFWNSGGEVQKLWEQLSNAMTKNGTNNEGHCNKMDDYRTPTKPEKTACNYLHAGLKYLKENSTLKTNNGEILSKDPSLKQAMGCFLLKKYAEKMKDTSKCVIDSGIEKAFKAWNEDNNSTCNGGVGASGKGPCVPCHWKEKDYEDCNINTNGSPTPVKDKLKEVQDKIDTTANNTLKDINKMSTLCDYIKCAAPKWFKNKAGNSGNSTQTWCAFWDTTVKDELQRMFKEIEDRGKYTNPACNEFGDGNEHSVERKACNHITAGLEHIKDITSSTSQSNASGQDNQLLDGAVGCIALNMYADQIKKDSQEKCPIDEKTISDMFEKWNEKNNNKSSPPCNGGGGNNNVCFKCTRQPNFSSCELSVDSSLVDKTTNGNCNDKDNTDRDNVQTEINNLLNNESNDQSNPNSIKSNITTTLTTITKMTSSFCTQVQCAAKKYHVTHNGAKSSDVTWNALRDEIGKELTDLLKDMNEATKQKDVEQYCKDDSKWNTRGHTERRTNRAACLHFAAGLQHIYGRPNGQKKGQFNGPSFGQTMGCLFLKEYAKQLKEMAKEKRKGHSWVHPYCSIDEGIKHAFDKSKNIMEETSPCNNGNNSCFECKLGEKYEDCKIGNDDIGSKSNELFKDDLTKQKQMEKTLENTVCPILLTDLLTPFLPLAPVSIGLSAMAYYLWKYFGPLGKGGSRFRRSPAQASRPSVQEQLLDHVQQDSSHEYQLVKERKPRSAPTRTKRSGPVNRRTIIEIHFEVLDECQKGDTQLNQKDFLELLVQEFMGSEFMEEEQVPKELVPMEGVPMELVPIEEVPSLGSGLLV
ncbi:SICAvar, type I [Plasmodium knowlesi strain H]|uniref:SICAvar, type I n=3 Tax=Plasmodium knowlesi TaxID=5850 RepID=A0A1A7VBV9_PLAKH|nr:SICAvar, type I [Plasmodium knowlesi strain H]OTN67618.1 SICAvar type I [Plasmodium knowlesi]CAA9990302.1 SICAvar, type I [Plasmodium knowlesi strain H]SBO19508.1 SICAvar, type I [Plasmodium knowlesi strain H]SBO22821.1 SICAvar, type I [Plasmodium knowlesi strain H]VVS79776.1 SICAvar, type I [Plasmodium knowlesi strain H]